MKNVLFIVYYFPPMGGSGVQRPLKFAKYLRDFGWNPIILCPEPGAYHTFDDSLNEELESLDLEIHRVKGNTPLHKVGDRKVQLSSVFENLLRKISTFFWLPDNKKGWIKPGLEKALEIIDKTDIDLIYATAAPYSNLVLAAELRKKTGVKTVMDLRDEWLDSHLIKYPTPWHRSRMAKIEEQTLEQADVITVINEAYLESFGKRFPARDIRLISQGFDPADFESGTPSEHDKIKLLYSGVFYGERNPDVFLEATAEVFSESSDLKEKVILQFQGGIPDSSFALAKKMGLERNIQNLGYLSHKESVKNLTNADALWLVIGHLQNAEHVTLGKMFEYFGARKPILGLVPEGKTRDMLQEYGASYLAHPSKKQEVKASIKQLLKDLESEAIPKISEHYLRKFDRIKITEELASLFDVISH